MPRPSKRYRCEKCGFFTRRKGDYDRHTTRKTKCVNERGATNPDPSKTTSAPWVAEGAPWVAESAPWVAESAPWVAESAPSVAESAPSVAEGAPSVAESAPSVAEGAPSVAESAPCPFFTCTTCERPFTRKRDLTRHLNKNKCKGVPVDKCPICSERFADKYEKYRHMRKGNCEPPPSVSTESPPCVSVSTTTSINNSVVNSNNNNTTIHQNVYVSLGKENTDPITSDHFFWYLLKHDKPEDIIQSIFKAMYFHPEYPENRDTIKPQSYKQRTVQARKEDGMYYTLPAYAVIDRLLDKAIPMVYDRCPPSKDMLQERIEGDKMMKHKLSKGLMALVSESPRFTAEQLGKDYNVQRFVIPDPPDHVRPWTFPSTLIGGWLREDRENKLVSLDKHVVYNETRDPKENEMYGVIGLLRELWDHRPPRNLAIQMVDNDIDRKWMIVRAWDGDKWVQVSHSQVSESTSEVTHLFASVAVDLCDALISHAKTRPVILKNNSWKIFDLEKLKQSILRDTGDHRKYFSAMYFCWSNPLQKAFK
nr:hypothetical protein TetV2_00349 [Oceanusvirus sp.]